MLALVLLLASAAEGRPLFYWGARPPVIAIASPSEATAEAQVAEVHAAMDEADLVVRFTFDRPVRSALYLSDGTPVSGRLRAVLYLDLDGDPTTGIERGPRDLRNGADRRLEVGVLSLGADPTEELAAQAVITASLVSLARDGRQKRLWARDDAGAPGQVSAHGEWVEVRVPLDRAGVRTGCRLILAAGDRAWDGRLP